MKNHRLTQSVLVVAALLLLALNACQPATPSPAPAPADTETPTPAPALVHTPTPTEAPYIEGLLLELIPGGGFLMGSVPEDELARPDELPQRSVVLPAFWIYKREVSNKLYRECVAAGACTPPTVLEEGPTTHYLDPEYDHHPVVGVTWAQAGAFCGFMNARLPSEAEWEKAARGPDGRLFPWGDEDPQCDQTNLLGCKDPQDTEKVGYLVHGQGIYEVDDMAGNVREWTSDWYDENAYARDGKLNPMGPAEGLKKVVRSGSYKDGTQEIRTAARDKEDPKESFEDVGFRCVPIGHASAPFCPTVLTGYCLDPDTPPPPEDCVPGSGIPEGGASGGPKITGMSCPKKGSVEVYFETGAPDASGYGATINGEPYECEPVPGYPSRLYCTGPALGSSASIQVEVCPPGAATTIEARAPEGPLPVLVYQPLAPALRLQLATAQDYALPQPVGLVLQRPSTGWLPEALGPDQLPTCPDGYIFDTASGQCTWTGGGDCPDGWGYQTGMQGCKPDDPDSCPPGTQFDTLKEACVPVDGECPEGYFQTNLETCEPGDGENQGLCPPGYRYSEDANCCLPGTPDNFGCPPDSFYDTMIERCLPLQDGCPWGTVYDPYEGCVDDGSQETGYPDNDNCPPNTTLAGDGITCQPDATDYQTPCPKGFYRDTQTGACLPYNPEGGEECPDGATFDWSTYTCMQNDENGCPPGSYFETTSEQCRPDRGPGSPCAEGYAYQSELECCVPLPGGDNSNCPPNGAVEPPEDYLQTQYPGVPYDGDYDPYGGNCQPGQMEECSKGYFFNDQGVCEPLDDGGECPPGTILDTMDNLCHPSDGQTCPEGSFFDTGRNACIPLQGDDDPRDDCAGNQYFDTLLGYCVSRGGDCCGLGYNYETLARTCGPVTGDGAAPVCVTFTFTTPACDGPCLLPQRYDSVNDRCYTPVDTPPEEEETEEAPPPNKPKCSDFSSPDTCSNNNAGLNCYWDTGFNKCMDG